MRALNHCPAFLVLFHVNSLMETKHDLHNTIPQQMDLLVLMDNRALEADMLNSRLIINDRSVQRLTDCCCHIY